MLKIDGKNGINYSSEFKRKMIMVGDFYVEVREC